MEQMYGHYLSAVDVNLNVKDGNESGMEVSLLTPMTRYHDLTDGGILCINLYISMIT